MKIRTINRYFSEAVKSIVRNRMMSLTSVVIVTACLLIMIVMYTVTLNVSSLMDGVATDVRIAVFIDNNVTPVGMNDINNLIFNHPYVHNTEPMTAEENMRRWIEDSANPALYENLTADMFRRRIDIFVGNVEHVAYLAEWLESDSIQIMGVDTVNAAPDVMATISTVSRTINVVFFAIIGVLAILSVVIITNTIRLTIDGRKNEIGIMKYIGSTNWFIRWPFLLEGMLLGLVGAMAAVVLIVAFYDRIIRMVILNIMYFIPNVSFLTGLDIFPTMIPAALLIGAFLGTFSSVVTIRRYLDV